jgi:membrane-associated HD superfamily phosphohydrolase
MMEEKHNMIWKVTNQQKSRYLITAIILLVGLGSAILIYLTAETAPDSVLGNEPKYSKMYMHDLELYGGKANVLASEFSRWFAGLWHGQSLAFTVACITIFISFGFSYVASHLPSDLKPDVRGENNGGKTD